MPAYGSAKSVSKAWKYCRQGHRLIDSNVYKSGTHRCCKICFKDYLIAYKLGWRQGKHRVKLVTCKRGHPFVGKNVVVDNRGTRHCATCMDQRKRYRNYLGKRNRRKVCDHGHRMCEGNTMIRNGLVKCAQCQRNWQAVHDKKVGIYRVKKQPRNEQERWESILKDFNLGMNVGMARLVYGEDEVTGGFAAEAKRKCDIRRPVL